MAGSQIAAPLHASAAPVHTTAVPALHTPVLQVSLWVHAFPSEHDVPSGATGFVHAPVAGLHVPAVWQASLGVQVTAGVVVTQLPAALQVSTPLHALPSEHEVPTATGVCVTPTAGSHASAVQGLPSSTVGAVPARHEPVALQSSAPLHALPSEHAVPAVAGTCVTPVAGLHASVVQGFPSSTVGGVPAWQAPDPLQSSAPLQALPSEQLVPALTGVCVTPVAGLHASAVHGLLSSTVGGVPAWHEPVALQTSAPLHALPSEHAVPALTGVCVAPVAGSHASAVQGFPSSSVGGVPAVHEPVALQASTPLHALPSEHELPALTGVCVTPVAGLHVSVVQGFPSSTVGGVPAWHEPVPLQISLPLHALPSEHAVPADTAVCVTPVAGSHASAVHGLPSSTVGGAPAVQAPVALQSSAPLHAFPSEHAVPEETAVCVTPVVGLHASVVQGLPSSTAGGVPA
jgi:hypothetical protein